MAVVAASHHLRGHVLDGAAEAVGAPLRLVRQELAGQTKVSQGNVAVTVQENVLQFNITIDDAVLKQQQ